jgi:predicted cation transporter
MHSRTVLYVYSRARGALLPLNYPLGDPLRTIARKRLRVQYVLYLHLCHNVNYLHTGVKYLWYIIAFSRKGKVKVAGRIVSLHHPEFEVTYY